MSATTIDVTPRIAKRATVSQKTQAGYLPEPGREISATAIRLAIAHAARLALRKIHGPRMDRRPNGLPDMYQRPNREDWVANARGFWMPINI